MSELKWTDAKEKVALSLAKGLTQQEAADNGGVTDRTVRRWLDIPEFSQEVDRLSHMVGIASRAERLRIANRVIRQFVKENTPDIKTEKDLLDWLKYSQGETDGIKLDLLNLLNDRSD